MYNKINSILIVEGNVEIYDDKNDLKIYGKKFTYDKINEKLFSRSKINALLNNKYKLESSELNYLLKMNY